MSTDTDHDRSDSPKLPKRRRLGRLVGPSNPVPAWVMVTWALSPLILLWILIGVAVATGPFGPWIHAVYGTIAVLLMLGWSAVRARYEAVGTRVAAFLAGFGVLANGLPSAV